MMLSTNAVKAKYDVLSNNNKELVSNLISHLEGSEKPRKVSFLGLLGALSMSVPEFFKPKDIMSDDEVDKLITSIRDERHASRNSH